MNKSNNNNDDEEIQVVEDTSSVDVKRLLANKNVEACYGRRMDSSDILLSTIEEMLSSQQQQVRDFLVMMCAPEMFMDFVQGILVKEGVPTERILKEKFM